MAGLAELLSGGLLDTSAPNYAAVAGRNERKRQGIIRLGLDQINAVFGGGTAPFYSPANTGENKFDPRQTYYGLTGKGEFAPYWAPGGARPSAGPFSPGIGTYTFRTAPGSPFLLSNIFGKKGDSPRKVAAKAFRRGQLFTAPQVQTFEGFQEPFFEQRAQDYVNFALPQLAQQYQQNRNAILFGLANRGLTGSSIEAQARASLEREAGKGRQTIADTGLEQANQLRRDIESARQQAISQLYQSADPAQALQGAVRTAIGFQAPSVLAPLTNMFANLAYTARRLLNDPQKPYGITDDYSSIGSYLAPIEV
jgi:hypothetical protein